MSETVVVADAGIRLRQAISDVLAGVVGCSIASIRSDVLYPGSRVDLDISILTPCGQVVLLLVFDDSGTPGTIRRRAPALRSLRDMFPSTPVLPVHCAPQLTERGLAACRELGIGGLDLAGNCLLTLPGLYVEVSTRTPRVQQKGMAAPPRPAERSIFSPRSSRILRVLLNEPERRWQVQELARTAGISIGLASEVKRRMVEEDFLIEEDRRVRVRDAQSLLEAWARTYRYRRSSVGEYYLMRELPAMEKLIASTCEAQGIAHALGLFSAAARLAPFVRMNKVFAYVDGRHDLLAQALGAKSVGSGANLMLLTPYDAGVLLGTTVVDGLPITSDIQTYLDLASYRGRGEEAANAILTQCLIPRWAVAHTEQA